MCIRDSGSTVVFLVFPLFFKHGQTLGKKALKLGVTTRHEMCIRDRVIDAEVPLSEMFGYVTDLRSFTQGRGTYTMTFDHYGECPRYIADEIVKKSGTSAR